MKRKIIIFTLIIFLILCFYSSTNHENSSITNRIDKYEYNKNGLKLQFNLSKDLLFDYFVLIYYKKIVITDFVINNMFNKYIEALKLKNNYLNFEIKELLDIYYYNYLPHSLFELNYKNFWILSFELSSYYENYYELIDNMYKFLPEDKKKKEYESYKKKEELRSSIETFLNLDFLYNKIITYVFSIIDENEDLISNLTNFISFKDPVNINLFLSLIVKGQNWWLSYGYFENQTVFCSYNFIFFQTLVHELLHYYFSQNKDKINLVEIVKQDSISKILTFYYMKMKIKDRAYEGLINSYIEEIIEPPLIVDWKEISNKGNKIKAEVYYKETDLPLEEYLVSILSYEIIEDLKDDFSNFYSNFKGIKSTGYVNISLNSYFKSFAQVKMAQDLVNEYLEIDLSSAYFLKEFILSSYRLLVFYSIFNRIDEYDLHKQWIRYRINELYNLFL
jgi:hypothetical protein